MKKARVYLAAAYGRRLEVLGYASDLIARGYHITSRWLDGSHDFNLAHDRSAQMALWSNEDLQDITNSDWVIHFTETPEQLAENPSRARGGRHVEYGIGLALGKYMLIVGPTEHTFHHLGTDYIFETWDDLLTWLDSGRAYDTDRPRP